MICVICGSNTSKIIANKVRDSLKHKIIQCIKCSHVQLFPVPSREEDKKFYDNNQQEKNLNPSISLQEHRKKKIIDTKKRFELISKIYKKNDRILEIGSGHGFLLEKMNESGFDVIGLEVSKERRKISKKVTKCKILNINLMDKNIDIGKFDLIVFFQVLEHISDSETFLKNLKNILKKKGTLIIEVPNYNDFQIELNTTYKKWHFQNAHIHYFTPKILKKILQKSGFNNIKIMGMQRYGIGNMFNWKINKKPQLHSPDFEFEEGYQWIEKIINNI